LTAAQLQTLSPSGTIPAADVVTTYDWKWFYNVPGLLLWIVLILAIVAPRTNRNPHILLLFIPLLIVSFLYAVFKRVTGMPVATAVQFDAFCQPLVFGTAVLWLLAHGLANLRPMARFLLASAVISGVALFGVPLGGAGNMAEAMLKSVALILIGMAILASFVVTGRLCRWQYLPGRFALWLALCDTTIGIVAMSVVFFITLAITPSRPDVWMVIPQVLFLGLLIGLCLYGIALPFVILGFRSVFFRDRLCKCLSLSSPQPRSEDPSGVADQTIR
jgi:hypothetical protein